MEQIPIDRAWEQALAGANQLIIKESLSNAVKSLLPFIEELQHVPPSLQMVNDLHRLSARKLGCALLQQAKGLTKDGFALKYAETLLTHGQTLVKKVVALKEYFIDRCEIHYNWLFHMPAPKTCCNCA